MDAWRAGGWVTYPSLAGWEGPWSMILPPGWQQLRGRPAGGGRCVSMAANQLDHPRRSRRAAARALGCRLVCRTDGGPGRGPAGVCDFAGLEFDAALAQRIAAPLPPSRHTLTPPAEGKWRRNVAEILRVLPDLQPTWQRLQELPTVSRRSGS